jgi:hypothetical protein
MSNRFHRHGDGDQPEDLPSDLASLRSRLISDGKIWQQETSAERLASFARSLPQRTMAHHDTPPTETSNHHTIDVQRAKGIPSMRYARARTIIPGAVVITIVALLAIIITQFTPGHSHSQPGGHVSIQHNNGWISVPKLSVHDNGDQINGLPVIAPTDPQVVYEASATIGQSAFIRRTDDGGTTWHSLPTPVSQAKINLITIYVSPLDAHTVFLFIWDDNTHDCSADLLTQWYDGEASYTPHCNLNYVSMDSGSHWTLLHLPDNGTFTSIAAQNGVTFGPFVARSTQLIAILDGNCPLGCIRIATSVDSINWHLTDSDLLASGQSICDFSGTKTGDIVFAVTAHSPHCARDDQVPHTLWKSTDGGTHWTSGATLPTPNEFGIAAINATTLYGYLPRTTHVGPTRNGIPDVTFSSSPNDVKVSTDGGITWQAAPFAGAPTGTEVGQIMGILDDGSVIVQFITNPANAYRDNGNLFAWKPGKSVWQQIESPLLYHIEALLVTPSKTSAQGVIWLTLYNGGGDYTVVRSQG